MAITWAKIAARMERLRVAANRRAQRKAKAPNGTPPAAAGGETPGHGLPTSQEK